MSSDTLKVGVIGMGNVGPALASAFREAGAELVGVSARSAEARDRADAMLPGVPVLSPQEVAKASDVLFLAVPDREIGPLTRRLADAGALRPGMIVVHLSGASGVDALRTADLLGAIPIALHPAMTFSGTSLDLLRLRGAPIAYTCSALAEPFALALITQLGGVPVKIGEDDRPLYHAALTHAANHLVTVLVQSEDVLGHLGVDEPARVLRPLVEAATERALEEGAAGLTGPVARGDSATVDAHVQALRSQRDLAEVASTYRALAGATQALVSTSSNSPRLVRTKEELRIALAEDTRETALVMTMGALHEGHLSLVELAKKGGRKVVVSVFVNPEQFGPGEDYDAYPRTLEADLEALAEVGADIVFAPSPEDVYPSPPRVRVMPGPASEILEGYLRPGHFAGVLQVVGKVMNLVRPEVAVFGQKDAQQFVNISQMVADLDVPVELVQAPIVRDDDGLALSSRNSYLNTEQREAALGLSYSLRAGAEAGTEPPAVVDAAAAALVAAGDIEPQYVALADAETFEVYGIWTPDGSQLGIRTVAAVKERRAAYLLVAARVGETRLIDNVIVELSPGE